MAVDPERHAPGGEYLHLAQPTGPHRRGKERVVDGGKWRSVDDPLGERRSWVP
jgi:hypothetical protein